MDDLVRWLGEQFDADAARALQWHDLECGIHAHIGAGLLATIATSRMLEDVPGAVCDCGGPTRVMAEIESKRAIVSLYDRASREAVRLAQAGEDSEEWVQTAGLLQLCICHLAVQYDQRPGYLAEWAPAP
jgi:Family of unknown function (DUF6221)